MDQFWHFMCVAANSSPAPKLSVIFMITVLAAQTCNFTQNVPSASPQTPEQWIEQYKCNDQMKISNWTKILLGDKCDRDASSWRWKYVAEFDTVPNDVLVKEQLIDQRLANELDTVRLLKTVAPYSFRFNSGSLSNDEKNKQLVAGPQVNDQVCRNQLKQMLASIHDLSQKLDNKRQNNASFELEYHQIQLARVLDSFGRYDSGFFSGKSYSIGAYGQCIGSQLSLSSHMDETRMRYCWAQFDLEEHLHPSLNRNKEKISRFTYNRTVLSAAICIPESCHSKSFAANRQLFQQLANEQFKLPKSMFLNESLELESIFCLVDERSEYLKWSLGTMLFVITMISWTLLTIGSTIYCRRRQNGSNHDESHQLTNTLTNCLDLRQSWCEMMNTNTGQPKTIGYRAKLVDLDSLNGIKVLCCCLIVLGHSYMNSYVRSTDILRSSSLVELEPQTLLIKIYFLLTDLFFVTGGILAGYMNIKKLSQLFKNQDNGGGFTKRQQLRQFVVLWLKMATSRYLRIVPLLFLLIWFEKSIFIHLGSGPMWDHGLDKDTTIGSCLQVSWTRPFNFFTGTQAFSDCSIPLWFVYCDLYAHILFVPPSIYLLAKKQVKLVYLITISIALMNCAMGLKQFVGLDPALAYELHEFRWIETFMRTDFLIIYTEPFNRVARVLIGVLAGHALYSYQANYISGRKQNKNHWPDWFRRPATCLSIAFLLTLTLMAICAAQMRKYLHPMIFESMEVLYITILPLMWCLSNATLLARLMTDWQDTWPARLGSHQLIKIICKHGYIIYLAHWDLLVYHFSITTTVIHYSKWLYYSTFGMVYFYSTLVATVVFVFIEHPLDMLTKKLILTRFD